jgi:DNA-binding NarL/FixJ family response regulator
MAESRTHSRRSSVHGELSRAGARARKRQADLGPGEEPIRVVVAEDAYVIREFLTAALGSSSPEVELVAVCTDGKELRSAIARWRPDVVITDIRMPPSGDEEGLEIAVELRDSHPEMGVIVLSQYAEPAYALTLLERGTGRRAYLLKERIRDRAELIAAIQTVACGGSVIDPMIVDVLIQARARVAESRLSQVTPRERELLAEIATGKSNGAIARSMFLTKRAVEKHVNSIFSKLDLPETEDVSRRVKATLIYLSEEGTETQSWQTPGR